MAYIKIKDRRKLERKEFRDYIKLSDDKVLDTKKTGMSYLVMMKYLYRWKIQKITGFQIMAGLRII